MEYSTASTAQRFKNKSNSYNQRQLRGAINSAMKATSLHYSSFHVQHAAHQYSNQIALDRTFSTVQSEVNNCNTLYPIFYQRQNIGYLSLVHKSPILSVEKNQINQVVSKIALLIKRFQTTELSRYYLKEDLALTGLSDKALKIERFIEKASSANCPVLIEGEFGCEKLSVASAIHYNSHIKHQPFIEINCSTLSLQEFKDKLMNCTELLSGGSVFLSDVDQLSLEQQNILIELLAASTIKNNESFATPFNKSIRLLVSSCCSFIDKVKKKQFSKVLYTQLNLLKVTVPPIRERKEDIPYIISNLIEKHRIYNDQAFSLEVEQVLCNYLWPENYSEIERVVVQLLTLSNNTIIRLTDLQEFTPQVLIKVQDKKRDHAFIIDNLFNKRYAEFSMFHKGLQKAVIHLAENYCNNVTLRELSENAFVSESHLSYLFKSHLNRSFKQILVELRIEKSKSIFKINPHCRITEVSLDAGFGDLSHFEKMFKRHTQLTPREYKNKIKLIR